MSQFKVKEALSDEKHLAKTIERFDRLHIDYDQALYSIKNYLEKCVEVWEDKELCGYFLIFNLNGIRSFHGYKFKNGWTRTALRMTEKILKDYDVIYSAFYHNKSFVGKFLKRCGFKEFKKEEQFTILKRG